MCSRYNGPTNRKGGKAVQRKPEKVKFAKINSLLAQAKQQHHADQYALLLALLDYFSTFRGAIAKLTKKLNLPSESKEGEYQEFFADGGAYETDSTRLMFPFQPEENREVISELAQKMSRVPNMQPMFVRDSDPFAIYISNANLQSIMPAIFTLVTAPRFRDVAAE